jgi:ABC-type nitrate/sulfonate/bicarbonate transport system ATPase subunit
LVHGLADDGARDAVRLGEPLLGGKAIARAQGAGIDLAAQARREPVGETLGDQRQRFRRGERRWRDSTWWSGHHTNRHRRRSTGLPSWRRVMRCRYFAGAGFCAPSSMASVTIQSVKKSFGETAVLHGVDIDIADGSFTVLVGPSGCGKSTLLRMIAGLEEITSGEIRIGERRVNDVPPKERDIAMVFQNYALYPHMTVRQNLAFSLMLAKQDKATIDQKVGRAAEILALSALMDRYPRQLSGGQRQRVAMGRAIVRDPQVFLYDEPLSNLDAKLRVAMRSELKELHQR